MAKRKRVLLKSKKRQDVQTVADFLRGLADRLENNEIVLQQGDQDVSLLLPDRVSFSVKVKEKIKKRGKKQSLQLKLKWVEGDQREGVSLG